MVQLLMPDSAESCYDELPVLLGLGGGVRVCRCAGVGGLEHYRKGFSN